MQENRQNQPFPQWPFRLLARFCPAQLYEEIEGDLLQKFERDTRIVGEKRAKRKLVWNALGFLRPGIILRSKFSMGIASPGIFRNYLLVAVRQMRRDKIFSFISISGLSVSMAACLLIFQYAFYEMHYDRQHEHANDLYRLATITYSENQVRYPSAMSSQMLASAMKDRFPEVENSARLFTTNNWFDCTLSYRNGQNTVIFNETNLFYADPSFLSLFHYPLLEGDARTVLANPFSIVLSSSVAKKYFGDEDAMGKILRLKGSDEDHDYVVTGVMYDPAVNSHINADILASVSSLNNNRSFKFFDAYTYIQIKPGIVSDQLNGKLKALANEMLPQAAKIRTELQLQPITDIHLHSALQDEMKASGDAKSVYFLMLVAFAVLLMAWINYVNLSASRSVLRAKEVGVRKVTGATRGQVIFQFLTETFVVNIVSVAVAALIFICAAPYFYDFLGLPFPPWNALVMNMGLTEWTLLLVFLVGIILSGVFPAQIISSYNPVHALKGRWMASHKGVSFRRAAVVFQFVCALVMMIAVITFNGQFRFMQNVDPRIDIRNALILKAPTDIDSTYRMRLSGFKNHLKNLSIIQNVSTSSAVPGKPIGWTGAIKNEHSETSLDFNINVIDPDFIEAYKLKLLAGRNFVTNDFPIGEHFGNKPEPVILNIKGIHQLGYDKAEEAIGSAIYWGANKCFIVGVVNDFHQESAKNPIPPILFTANTGPSMTLKLTEGATKDIGPSLISIRKAWNVYFPNNPFDFAFLEDVYHHQYARDEQQARLFDLFCSLSIVISGLGLFALSLFSATRRAKEIGIRKLLGASWIHLVRLLTSEYFLLIVTASALAIPIASWGLSRWLQGFALHIEMSSWFYAFPVIITLATALLSVISQTIRVIAKNPSDSLKYE